ncbi:nuclear receptor coactivator 3-like [Pelobates fuscus]|uniref:nuclear receptor coactivator 3-like n=1 Tax=Pelobates fuscus TaxID=191477 RepID=UPI002FE45C33
MKVETLNSGGAGVMRPVMQTPVGSQERFLNAQKVAQRNRVDQPPHPVAENGHGDAAATRITLKLWPISKVTASASMGNPLPGPPMPQAYPQQFSYPSNYGNNQQPDPTFGRVSCPHIAMMPSRRAPSQNPRYLTTQMYQSPDMSSTKPEATLDFMRP